MNRADVIADVFMMTGLASLGFFFSSLFSITVQNRGRQREEMEGKREREKESARKRRSERGRERLVEAELKRLFVAFNINSFHGLLTQAVQRAQDLWLPLMGMLRIKGLSSALLKPLLSHSGPLLFTPLLKTQAHLKPYSSNSQLVWFRT